LLKSAVLDVAASGSVVVANFVSDYVMLYIFINKPLLARKGVLVLA